MEIANFSSSNIEFIIKPRTARELNIKYDFKHLNRVLKRMKDYKNSLIEEKINDSCHMEVEESGNKKSKYNDESYVKKENFEKNNNSNFFDIEPSFGEYIVKELRDGYFHVKGRVHNFSAVPSKSEGNITNGKFDIRLILKGGECMYHLLLEGVSYDILENLNKLRKKAIVYAIKFKASIEIFEGEYKLILHPISLNEIYSSKNYSKIYIHQSGFNDNHTLLNFNHSVRGVYETEMKKYFDKKSLIKSRLSYTNGSMLNGNFNFNQNYTANGEFSQFDNLYNYDINASFILTPGLNDSNRLNNCITQSEDFPDICDLLIKDVEHSIYGMTNVMRINSTQVRKDVFGMIKSIKTDEKLDTIELISLKDSNVIKVLHYNKHINLNLKENMVISIKGIILKVNKNFDFYLENPELSSIKIHDILDEEETNKLKKFRFNKNKDFSCLIELTKPILIRTIQKYLVTFKKIYKIMAINEKNSCVISGFPDLRLIAKCLVDDGTFEAQVYLHDQSVVNFFRIDKTTLNSINKLSEESGNVVIYEKLNAYKVLPKSYFDTIYIEQFIVYCVPFSNVAKKHFYDNNYNRYFENIGQINNLKNKALNMAFINGDIIFDKIQSNYLTLIPRPFLRVLHIESIE